MLYLTVLTRFDGIWVPHLKCIKGEQDLGQTFYGVKVERGIENYSWGSLGRGGTLTNVIWKDCKNCDVKC